MNPSRSIKNKADALHFAILATAQYKCGEPTKINYEEAEKLFNFFCEHVEFPEESTRQMLGQILPVLEGILNGNPYDLASELSKLKVDECSN